jgi:hypothetical protein
VLAAVFSLVLVVAPFRLEERDDGPRAAAPHPPTMAGLYLDHVPIAVRDLGAATSWWHEGLGFSIKPGRLHENTLDNSHMKFPDGSEIELITAGEPADPLAARYRQLIERGDGPAFLALRPDTLGRIAARLGRVGIEFHMSRGPYFESLGFDEETSLGYLFFIVLTSPPVDLPEQITHANTGTTLFAAWLRDEDFGPEERIFAALGVPIRRNAVELPGGIRADDVVLDRGHLYLLRSPNPVGADRPVVGLTVAVADLDEAEATLRGPLRPIAGHDPRGRYLRIEPEDANGAWLEFLEPGAYPGRK